MNKNNFVDLIERQEMLDKLRDAGLGEFVAVMTDHGCYTKKGKLNRCERAGRWAGSRRRCGPHWSGAGRSWGWNRVEENITP